MMTAYYETKQYYQQFDRHQPLAFDELGTGASLHITAPATDTLCFKHLESEAMIEMINHLEMEVARVVYLRFVEEMSLKEIAEIEDTSVSKAWRMIQKGLAELKEIIVNSDNDSPDNA